MTSDKLSSVREKLARARLHFNAIQKFALELGADHTNYGRQTYNHQSGEYEFYTDEDWPPPPHVPAIIGDFLHNARSALDHLACALAKRQTKRTGFPVFNNPTGFACFAGVQMTSMKASAKAIIERFQPYQRPDGLYSLWWLHELNNIDKHRAVLVTTLNSVGMVTSDGLPDLTPLHFPVQPLKRGAKFMSAKAPFHAGIDYHYLPIGRIGIADSPVNGRLAEDVAAIILGHIEDKLLPAFSASDFP